MKSIIVFSSILAIIFSFFPIFTPAAYAADAFDNLAEFTPGDCEFELPVNLVEGRDVNCGFLSVPLNYDNPQGEKIRLAVAIITSTSAAPAADPLIMAQGGPGGSTIDTFLKQFSISDRLRADRDVILLEQRGTLYSTPSLMCQEIQQMTVEMLEKDVTQEEAADLSLQATQECRERLVASGVNLSAFDSLENAKDIESLRLAFGYDKINLYGVSYGTLLALHYMNLFPQNLRSVILDGVLPPQINFLLQTTSTVDESLKKLFAACQADPDCQQAYPHLEEVFFSLVDQFNQTPATFPMTDTESGITYQAVFDGDSFLNSIAQMLYATSIIPALPRVIYDAQSGEFGFLSRIMSLVLFDRTLAYGMYYSVLCAEDSDFSAAQQALEGVHPAVVEAMQRGPQDFLDTCQMWNVENLDSSVDLPVSSDIPALLLSGEFDPVTPSKYALETAQTLENSTLVTFPNGGHGQAFEGECQDQIILDFLESPQVSPDISCVEQIDGVDFYNKRNVINAPFVFGLINLDQSTVIQFMVLLISGLFLFSAVIILPLAGIIRRVSKPVEEDLITETAETVPTRVVPLPARMIGGLGFLVGLLAPLFLIGMVASIVVMVANNDNRLLYGLAGEARPWMVLPAVILLVCLFWLVALIQAWNDRIGSLAMRIYYSFLFANAAAYLAVLVMWGLLFTFI